MNPFLWTAVVLFALTAVPSALFFVLHVATGEPVPLARAKALYRWAVVIALGTFDIAIFTRVFQGLWAIWF
jgi:hypothetical protein